jgi:hypothetical protein
MRMQTSSIQIMMKSRLDHTAVGLKSQRRTQWGAEQVCKAGIGLH